MPRPWQETEADNRKEGRTPEEHARRYHGSSIRDALVGKRVINRCLGPASLAFREGVWYVPPQMASRMPRQAHWEVDMKLLRFASATVIAAGLALAGMLGMSDSVAAQQQLVSNSSSLCGGPTPMVGQLRSLSGGEIYSLLAGRTLRGQAKADCKRYTMQFRADWTVSANLEWRQGSTSGQWSTADDRLNIRWSNGTSESWGLRTDGARYFPAGNLNEVSVSTQ